MRQEHAETIALQVLGWLVSNEDLLPVFLGSSGASAEQLGGRAQDAEFLGSVLDFLMMSDEWLVACCDANGIDYGQPMLARQALPGGEAINWT